MKKINLNTIALMDKEGYIDTTFNSNYLVVGQDAHDSNEFEYMIDYSLIDLEATKRKSGARLNSFSIEDNNSESFNTRLKNILGVNIPKNNSINSLLDSLYTFNVSKITRGNYGAVVVNKNKRKVITWYRLELLEVFLTSLSKKSFCLSDGEFLFLGSIVEEEYILEIILKSNFLEEEEFSISDLAVIDYLNSKANIQKTA